MLLPLLLLKLVGLPAPQFRRYAMAVEVVEFRLLVEAAVRHASHAIHATYFPKAVVGAGSAIAFTATARASRSAALALESRAHGGGALAAGGALALGVYEEAQLDDAVFQMIWHAGIASNAGNKKKYRDLLQKTASQTGFGYHDIAEAATNEIRLMKGAPGAGLDILPEMLRAAATESRLKGTSLQGSMSSLVEMAHMTKEYSPEQIKALAPIFGFLSTANPATLPQMGRAASYAMPTLQSGLHMDPADVLFQTTALARAGATNTKSGTWVRSAFERALPPDARFTGEKEYNKRISAMRELGLVDGAGKSTILDPTGDHIDIEEVSGHCPEQVKLNVYR